MTVIAPPTDPAGAALDAQIATVQALITANVNPLIKYSLQQQLNQLQVAVVEHYMVTGWLNAAAILALYSVPAGDNVGAVLTARVLFLTNLVANAPAPLPGNPDGYGGAGWVTVAQNYTQALYAAQIALVERILDVPGGTSAGVILAAMTGVQSFPFAYTFNSVGFTDVWIDD